MLAECGSAIVVVDGIFLGNVGACWLGVSDVQLS
jgi:hypothetical protein